MSDEAPAPTEENDSRAQRPPERPRSRLFRLGKSALLRFFILPAASVYSAALIVGAMPNEIRPRALDVAHKHANEFFADYIQTVAGLPLFTGSGTSDYRRKGMCWVMVGVLPDGTQRRVYESYPSCEYPAVRVFNRDFDTYLQRLLWLDFRRLESPKLERRNEVVARLRRSGEMRKVGRYFCESKLENNADIESLYVVWRYSSIRYKTGRVYPLDAVVHHYSCAKQRSQYHRSWPDIALSDDGSVRLEIR